MTPHCAHCLHFARRVGFCHHPALSNSGSCCPLHQEPSKSRTGLSLSNLSASCQSKRPARLGFCWPFRSLHAHLPEPQIPPCWPPPLQTAPLLSAARLLPFQRSLCDRVHVYCYLFKESSSCRRSFFNWATPVKLCSSVFCMLIDCLLHQFLGSIQETVHVSHRNHVVKELQQQVVKVRLCLSAISLTTCRLDDICKDVLH